MKKPFFLLLTFLSIACFSQEKSVIGIADSNPLELPFAVVEQMPIFQGCEGVKQEEILKCFKTKINQHIIKHFKYPEDARTQNIEGKVMVHFTINTVGEVENIQILGAHSILRQAARHIFEALPKMEPGIHKGEPVNVRFTMPLNFKLT